MEHQAFLRSVKETAAPKGTAALWWMGQMGLWVKMGATLVSVDYFASPGHGRSVPPPVPAEAVTGIDAFLGTHDHLDHMDRASWRLWLETCPGARFVFPRAYLPSLLREGFPPDRLVGLNAGEACRVGEITVKALPAAHEFLDRDEETGLYPCLQYILEGNGVRLYHAGDTLRYEGMLGRLCSFGPIDGALLPINGRDGERYRRNCIGNMTFQEAADLAGELRPRLTIPGHWDMFPGNTADPAAFADYLDAKYGGGVPCRIPRIMEKILVGAEQ